MDILLANTNDVTFDIQKILDTQPYVRSLPFDGMDKSNAPVCLRFLRNECQLGDRCCYSHMRRDKTIVCKHWLRGLCKKGENCEYLHHHDPDKMPECHFFVTYGRCANKDCPFLHKKPETEVCPWFDRGFCRHGPTCKKRHVVRMLCPDFVFDECQKGTDCELFHPTFDLPEVNTQAPGRFQIVGNGGNGTTVQQLKMPETGGPAIVQPVGPGRQMNYRPLDQVTCYKCNEKGHYANKCPKSFQNRKNMAI